jgi:hypothetical protein
MEVIIKQRQNAAKNMYKQPRGKLAYAERRGRQIQPTSSQTE